MDQDNMSMKEARRTLRAAVRAGLNVNERPSDLCAVPMAAAMAGLNQFTVWRWIREGRIRKWGYKRAWRVSLSELLPEGHANEDC